jgi:hypothetical protein
LLCRWPLSTVSPLTIRWRFIGLLSPSSAP